MLLLHHGCGDDAPFRRSVCTIHAAEGHRFRRRIQSYSKNKILTALVAPATADFLLLRFIIVILKCGFGIFITPSYKTKDRLQNCKRSGHWVLFLLFGNSCLTGIFGQQGAKG